MRIETVYMPQSDVIAQFRGTKSSPLFCIPVASFSHIIPRWVSVSAPLSSSCTPLRCSRAADRPTAPHSAATGGSQLGRRRSWPRWCVVVISSRTRAARCVTRNGTCHILCCRHDFCGFLTNTSFRPSVSYHYHNSAQGCSGRSLSQLSWGEM